MVILDLLGAFRRLVRGLPDMLPTEMVSTPHPDLQKNLPVDSYMILRYVAVFIFLCLVIWPGFPLQPYGRLCRLFLPVALDWAGVHLDMTPIM